MRRLSLVLLFLLASLASVRAALIVSPTTSSVLVGQSVQLTVTGGNGAPKWTSSNPNLASVTPDGGLVTGLAAGTATITVKRGNQTGQATVTVSAAPQPPVDCVVSGWSEWSACTNGSQTRTRSILTPPSNGGAACPALSETQSCTPPPPPPGCTLTATTGNLTDVQQAVDQALDGDTVCVPAGFYTWASHVGWANKDVTVLGAGVGNTVITRDGGDNQYTFYVVLSNATKGQFRISGMTLQGAAQVTSVIYITSSTLAAVPAGRWRIDHLRMNFPTGQRSGVHVTGVNYGVIDHVTFDWNDGAAIRLAAFLSTECYTGSLLAGDFANQQALDLGTDRFVVVEDSTLTAANGRPLAAYDASSGGGRLVWRHNTVTGGFLYNHWTRGCEMASQVMEIYHNTFIGTAGYSAYPMRIEAGTGVVFNNTVQNYNGGAPYLIIDDRRSGGFGGESSAPLGACDGSHAWDGNAGDPLAPGWPCLGQIGRAPGKSFADIQAGDKPASAPFYFWNNGQEAGCASGGSCTNTVGVYAEPSAYVKTTPHPNGDVDYVENTAKPGYAPLAYPHPRTQP